MNLTRENIVVAAGALVALVLQVVVAPNIALFSAQPNFLLAYVLVAAIANPHGEGPVMPFLLGLAYDLLGTGPVGGMALLFVLASFAASRAFAVLDNDTLFMPLTILAVAAFAVEMIYGALLVALGLPAGPLDAFLYRALPCALYDCVVGLVLYPLAARLLAGGAQDRGPRTPRLR
ncbi:rod shape-determining protein MreD [Arabiibacter massiliensis]|uniref:rod shape-determining protein MreD n=1 Tax=Arabiibacter massiliensis TaxID=1870985 RepID=UPI0009BB35D2|nr:rod shape-determining protein MreD [Arabiibacter massiliensis]